MLLFSDTYIAPLGIHAMFIFRVLTLLCALSALKCQAELVHIFSVGNSLSVDLRSQGGVELLSRDEARPILHDYHIKCGSSLTSIVANPTSTCVPPLRWGLYQDAFRNTRLDAVTFQPFQGAKIRDEIQSILTLAHQLRSNPINANTKILIYATAPYQSEGPFLQSWNRNGLDLDSPFQSSKQSFDLILSEVRTQIPDAQILPAVHIMAAIAEQMENTPDAIPGLASPSQFYRDDIHGSNVGRFIEGIALFSSVYEKSSEGLPLNWAYQLPDYGHTLTNPDGILEVQKTAWNVSKMYGGSSVPEPSSLSLVALATIALANKPLRRFARLILAQSK
jgi:hypothetical protein